MSQIAQFRRETLGMSLNRVPSLTLDGVRLAATFNPEMLPDAIAWAAKFHKHNSLARPA